MKVFFCIYIFFLFAAVGCRDKTVAKNSDIEIYLLNKRIETNLGIPLKDYYISGGVDVEKIDSLRLKYTNFDTITKQEIYAGPFKATRSDLNKSPLITDEEFIGFNFDTNELTINAKGLLKIHEMGNPAEFSTQFVITDKKKPIFTGYFFSIYSSSAVHDYYIVLDEPDGQFRDLVIRYKLTSTEFDVYKLPDLTKNLEFYEAFNNADKIIVD